MAALAASPSLPMSRPPQQQHAAGDVRAFGAVGDGVTDDTTAIQAALNAGDIVIPAGTYLVSSQLTTSAARTIQAQLGARLVKRAGPSSFPTLRAAATLRLSGLTIDGGSRSTRANLGIALTGHADDSVITDCVFTNLQQAIQFYSGTAASRVTLERNRLETCTWGILIPPGGTNVTDDLRIVGNTFFDIAADPIEVQATAPGSSLARLQIVGNGIRRLTGTSRLSGFGIGVAGAVRDGVPTVDGAIVAYNHIDGENNGSTQGGHQGIHIEGQRGTLVLGNVIRNVGDTGGTRERNGIHCLTDHPSETGLQIVGNSVVGCAGHGIRVVGTSTAQRPVIVGNVAAENRGNGISLGEAVDALVAGNSTMHNGGVGIAIGGPAPRGLLVTGNNAAGNTTADITISRGIGDSTLSDNRGDVQDGARVLSRRHGLLEAQGTGSPEGVVSAPVGSLYRRTDGGRGTSLYIKESGSDKTGWVAK